MFQSLWICHTSSARHVRCREALRRVALACCLASLLAPGRCLAGEIILPSPALERDEPIRVLYRTGSLATGKGELSLRWTDVYGRVIEDRKIAFELTDESEVGFTLDLRRAVAMQNELSAHFSFEGVDKKGVKDHREEDARVCFIARPPDRTWWDYAIIMWQQHSAKTFAVLKTLGINAGQYTGKAKTPPEFLLENDLRWYAENIATDFYSEYHRWFPDRPVNWKFQEAKELYKNDPGSREAFKRYPSLSDPKWLKKIQDRLVGSARLNSPYRPLFYDLGDEAGIADLAAFWDFDFSDHSLAEMRHWLKERYGTLAALNRQWGTHFAAWDLVIPMTTTEAMKRSDDNFSAWADFKEWMDIAFARAIHGGVEAVRSVDPEAYVAIAGAQLPGWGGYDYARLSKVLNAIEPYDYGANVEIIRSLNPRMVMTTTSFGRGPEEKRRIWYELLHGSRGIILWDAKSEYAQEDGSVGPRGRESEPYYKELRGGLGALLINSERQSDPIAIHHSQASFRTEWMLQHRPKGEAWVGRTASSEYEDNEFRWRRESYCRLIEDLGWQYNFVDSDQVEEGELVRGGYRMLVLPHSTALSEAEANAIREFVEQGGVVIADGQPGAFDEHARRLSAARLAELFGGPYTESATVRPFGRGKAIYLSVDLLSYFRDRLLGQERQAYELMSRLLRESLGQPAFAATDPSGEPVVGVETHTYRNGGVHIVALHANPQSGLEDVGPPEKISNRRFEKPRTVTLALPGEHDVYDVRAGQALGRAKQLTVELDPYEPRIFACSLTPLPALRVSAPGRLKRGETGRIGISVLGDSPAAVHVFHVEVVDPSGNVVAHYSGNVLAPDGAAGKRLPLAINDSPGRWEVRVRDLLSGQIQSVTVHAL